MRRQIRTMLGPIGFRRLCCAWCLSWIVLAPLLCLVGCTTKRAPAGPSHGKIEQIHLFLTSVALSMNGKVGSEGFGARIYASLHESTAIVPVTEGTVEFLLFDGVVIGDGVKTNTPLKKWSFSQSDLRRYAQPTAVGMSYQLALLWGETRPVRPRVTVVVRYFPSPGSTPIYSAPGSIPVTIR